MRAGLVFAVALLLAACAGAPQPTGALPSPSTEPPAGDGGLRVLATELWGDFESPFSVAAATDEAEYDQLWTQVGQQIPQPEVDFPRELVLFLGMAGSSSCPERFARLMVDETSHVFAEWWRDEAGPCTDDLAPQGLLLAVDRALLPDEPFPFSLRAQPICPDCPTHPDQMVVDPR